MRFYKGETLESLLGANRSSGRHLAVADAFGTLGALIDGLTALHAAGIHHRDIKPANILVEESSDSPIIMDLGVVSDFLLTEQTQTTDLLGLIRYADPKYLTGGQFTAASDWYSVGLIGYELFFNKQFLDSEKHWANLVAQKVSKRLPSTLDFAEQCAKLTDRLGQDASEAVFHTLNTLLFKSAPQNLQRLQGAISEAFWTSGSRAI